MYVFILILIIILLVIFLYYRTQKYNTFLKNISRENFSSKIQHKNKTKIIKELPSNPNIVFCDFDGNTFFIKENKVWKMDNNYEISLNSVKIDSVFNLPYSINIKTGTLQNKNLVILTHENNVIEYDLIERKLDGKIIYEAKKNGKNHVFSFFDNIIIYSFNKGKNN